MSRWALQNLDLTSRLTPIQKMALEGFREGPFDFDVKYYSSSEDVAAGLKEAVRRRGDSLPIESLELADGRRVVRACLKGPDDIVYSVDTVQRLPNNDRTRVLADFRKGPHQTGKADVAGLLARDNETGQTVIALDPKDIEVLQGKSVIEFSEYKNIIQALLAFAKMLRIDLLSPTQGNSLAIDRYSSNLFFLRIQKLATTGQSSGAVPAYRVAEFMREMLICMTTAPQTSLDWMERYGVSSVLFPKGIPTAVEDFSLFHRRIDEVNPWSLVQALQAFDPTGKFV